MQIHELNNYSGSLGDAYLVADNGSDTGKVKTTALTDPLNERIDNIIAGPAPSAAEIVDARLGEDGVIYPSLGDAVRGQIRDVNKVLSLIEPYTQKPINWINLDTSVDGMLSASGGTYSEAGFKTTDFIPAKVGDIITEWANLVDGNVSLTTIPRLATYNANKKKITVTETWAAGARYEIVDDDTAYIRVSFNATTGKMVCINDNADVDITPYSEYFDPFKSAIKVEQINRNTERITVLEEHVNKHDDNTFAINIRDLQGSDSLCFAWASDTHFQSHPTNPYGLSLDKFNEMAGLAENVKADFIALSGDIVNGYYNLVEQKTDLRNVVNVLRDTYAKSILMMQGNHDDNSWYASGNASDSTVRDLSQVLKPYQVTGYMMNNTMEDVVFDAENGLGGYYYIDFKRPKIRVIVLNTNDIPYVIDTTTGTIKWYGQYRLGFQQRQLEWLANVALKFDEEDWGVITIRHLDGYGAYGTEDTSRGVMGENVCETILNGFRTKTSGNATKGIDGDYGWVINVDYDFTNNKSDEFIASFYGHTHADKVSTYNEVPRISIINAFNAMGGGYDFVTISRINRKIYTYRYNGEPMPSYNRTISY